MYYCIIEQHGKMRSDWRPLDLGDRIAVYSNKKRAKAMLAFYKKVYPNKAKKLWLATIAIGIRHHETEQVTEWK
jgi:hypothetical protein